MPSRQRGGRFSLARDPYLFPGLKELKGAAPRHHLIRSTFEDAYNYMKSGTLLHQVINKLNEGIKTRIKQELLEKCNPHSIVRLPNDGFAPYTGIKTNLLFFTKGEPTKEIWYYEHPIRQA